MEEDSSRPYSFKVGNHTLIRGDCLNVLRKMPESSVDVVVTSPPYNLGIAYNSYKDQKAETEYLDWLVSICIEIKRVIKKDGAFFLNIAGSSSNPWLPFELMVRLRKIFYLQNHIEWVKSISIGTNSHGHFKPVVSNRFLHRNHENLFHLTKTGNVKINRLGVGVPYKDKSNIIRRSHQHDLRCRGDVWFVPYDTIRKKAEKFNHPGTFPVTLPQMCLKLHGIPNPLVVDPFMGTGTTLLATHLEGGRAIGIDIDRNYVKIAKERIKTLFSSDEHSSKS
ncbi:site-specific DNA-methyltransferase [Commensalibacter sp. TBRC 16381]|uniref:Methyltransferase n=1 Tax=Commensalibacter oyaizuii TaxID=3043873 RepID=A0ABT6PYS6_9PROT|nr:site-specific DNA-methyltransferase [Commensalibacter sp. TBRC 16381]MDI2090015.1 site-specific DNA-methyltransferase [Commensalibacter sp. TBRC 16381]